MRGRDPDVLMDSNLAFSANYPVWVWVSSGALNLLGEMAGFHRRF
jgi:hypothetical protein